MNCPEERFKNGEFQIKIQKFKDNILFINWFNVSMLSENTPNIKFVQKTLRLEPKNQRQLYFYNSEERGCNIIN